MKYAIVYSTRTGNTKMLAETIRDTLPAGDCVYFGAPNEKALQADRIYVGFWTDKGSCDEDTARFLSTVTQQEVYLFGTAGFGSQQAYFDQVAARAAEHLPQGVKLAGSFMCQGKMPLAVRQRYLNMQSSGMQVPNLNLLIENFDKALTHPDAQDLAALAAAVQAL